MKRSNHCLQTNSALVSHKDPVSGHYLSAQLKKIVFYIQRCSLHVLLVNNKSSDERIRNNNGKLCPE